MPTAEIGDGVAFATKPELAWAMVSRAWKAWVPFAWIPGDEACGGNPGRPARLEEADIPYVMATACSDVIAMAASGMRADEADDQPPGTPGCSCCGTRSTCCAGPIRGPGSTWPPAQSSPR